MATVLRARTVAVAAAAVGTAALFAPFAPLGVDAHHDGLMLKTAMDVQAGQRLFRDTFTQYGPLTTWIHAGALALWGPRLLVLKLVTVGAYAVAAAALVAVWARLLPPVLLATALVAWLALAPFYGAVWIMHPWASVIALAFQACSLHAFARALESPRIRVWAAASGGWAALAVLARTPVGVLHTAALVVAFLWVGLARRSVAPIRDGLGAFLAAALGTTGLVVGWLLVTGTVGDWYEQIVLGPAAWAASKSGGVWTSLGALIPGTTSLMRLDGFAFFRTWRSFPGALVALGALIAIPIAYGGKSRVALAVACAAALGVAFALDPFLLTTGQGLAIVIPLGMLVTVGLGIARVAAGRDVDAPTTLAVALAIAAIASWLQYVPTNDPRHVFWAIAPAIGPFVFLVHRLVRRRTAVALLLLAAIVVPVAAFKAAAARAKLVGGYVAVRDVPVLAGMRVSPDDAAEYERLQRALTEYAARRPGRPIVVLGSNALVATFASDLRNPQPYFVQLADAPAMRMRDDALRRFVEQERALVLVEPLRPATIRRVIDDFGYVELARERDRVLLAPP